VHLEIPYLIGGTCGRALLFLSLTAIFDKRAVAILLEGDVQFFPSIHHYGSVPDDRLAACLMNVPFWYSWEA